MARKDSSALFEVIDRGRPLSQQARPGILRTIGSWFSSRPKDGSAAPVSLSVPPPTIQAAIAPELIAPPVLTPRVELPADAPSPGERRVMIDPERREISFRLTYLSAGACAMAVLTVVAAAFMAGQRSGTRPRPALAASSEQVMAQPPQGNVVDLTNVRRGSEPAPDDPVPPPANNLTPPVPPTTGANNVVRDRRRSAGLNYIVIQSYPDQKTAAEAAAVLAQSGIDCTVEKGLPHWGTASWHSLVGVDGFARLSSNPQYDAYLRKIKEISDKFARRGSFKAFDPKPYKWGRT